MVSFLLPVTLDMSIDKPIPDPYLNLLLHSISFYIVKSSKRFTNFVLKYVFWVIVLAGLKSQ